LEFKLPLLFGWDGQFISPLFSMLSVSCDAGAVENPRGFGGGAAWWGVWVFFFATEEFG
jgi:hypothetical protein